MNENRTKKSLNNIFAGMINKIVSLAVPFLIRTLIIQKLGMEYLGLNSLFTSILQVLSLTELGFGSAMVYSMYEPIANNDSEKISALLYFYKRIYKYMGIAILSIGVALMPFIKGLISSGYPSEINIYYVYLIYLVNTVVSYFLFAYKSSLLVACMRSDIDSNITTICNFFMYALQAISLIVVSDYYLYAFFIPLSTIVGNIIRSIIVDKKFPQYKVVGQLCQDEINDIKKRVLALAGHRLGGVIFSSADSIVISSFLGLVILGRYSNYFYIYTAVNGIIAIVFQSIIAIIGNSIAIESKEKNMSDFKYIFFANGWIAGACSICFLCLYQPFIYIWVGKENLLPFSIPLLLSIYFYVANVRRVETMYKDAAGMWNADFFKPYVSVIVNVSANILLVNVWGLEGVIVSSIIAILFVEIPWEVHVLYRDYFNKSVKNYYVDLLKITIIFLLIAVITYIVCNQISYNVYGVIVRAIICVILPNIIMFIIFRKSNEMLFWLDKFARLKK